MFKTTLKDSWLNKKLTANLLVLIMQQTLLELKDSVNILQEIIQMLSLCNYSDNKQIKNPPLKVKEYVQMALIQLVLQQTMKITSAELTDMTRISMSTFATIVK